jgi:hypothetical protein
MAVEIMADNYPPVRYYLTHMRFAFVIGYPRSGGRAIGIKNIID